MLSFGYSLEWDRNQVGHLVVSSDHSMACVSLMILFSTFASRLAVNSDSMLATVSSICLEHFVTSTPAVLAIIMVCSSPCSVSSPAAASVMYEPVEHGSSLTFTYINFGPLLIKVSKTINDTGSAQLVVCLHCWVRTLR